MSIDFEMLVSPEILTHLKIEYSKLINYFQKRETKFV